MAHEKILGFDTVSSVCSVCIYDGEYHQFETETSFGHAGELMPLIDRALKSLSYTIKDMDAIVVSLGPGSFTGIRIGLSTALGLSKGSGIPCYGVDSLLSRIYPYEGKIRIPLMDARRGNVYGAAYGSFHKEAFNGPFLELVEELQERKNKDEILFIGEKLENFYGQAKSLENYDFLPAKELAKGVIQAYLDGKGQRDLRPIYLREAEAKQRLEEKHAHSRN